MLPETATFHIDALVEQGAHVPEGVAPKSHTFCGGALDAPPGERLLRGLPSFARRVEADSWCDGLCPGATCE